MILGTVNNTFGAFMAQDGRYLSYGTGTSLLSPLTTASLYDTCIGAPPGCSQATVATVAQSQTANSVPVPSASGRYLAYQNTSSQILLHDSCLGAAPGCVPSENVVSDTTLLCEAPTISPDAGYMAWTCWPSNGTIRTAYLQATCLSAPPGCSTTPSPIGSPVQYVGSLAISVGGRFTAFEGGIGLGGSLCLRQL